MSLLEKKLKKCRDNGHEDNDYNNGGDAAFAAILFVRVVYVRGVEAIGAVVWAVIACTLLAVVIEGGKLFGS